MRLPLENLVNLDEGLAIGVVGNVSQNLRPVLGEHRFELLCRLNEDRGHADKWRLRA